MKGTIKVRKEWRGATQLGLNEEDQHNKEGMDETTTIKREWRGPQQLRGDREDHNN